MASPSAGASAASCRCTTLEHRRVVGTQHQLVEFVGGGRAAAHGGEQIGAADERLEVDVAGAPAAGVPELARVPSGTAEQRAADDDPAADARRSAVEVDEVVDTAADAVDVLDERAEAGVVADRDLEAGRLGEQGGDRFVRPLQVRGEADEAVADAHQAGHRDPDADHAGVRREVGGELVHELGADRDGLARGRRSIGLVPQSWRPPGRRGRRRRPSRHPPRG